MKRKHFCFFVALTTVCISACSHLTVPLTCEGVSTGIEIAVKNQSKLSDKDLIIVKTVRDEVAPICGAEQQPTLSGAAKKLVEENVKKLNVVLSNYDKKELTE